MESGSELLHAMDELQQIALRVLKEDDLIFTLNSPNWSRKMNTLHLKVTIAGFEIIHTDGKMIEAVLTLSDRWSGTGGDDLQHSPRWQANKISSVGFKPCGLLEPE